MKTNYYYKGQKIRTSEREYTHAVIIEINEKFSTIACCGNYELACKRFNTQLNDYERALNSYINAIESIEKNTYKEWGYNKNKVYCRCVELSEEKKNELYIRFNKSIEELKLRIKSLKIVEITKDAE